MAGRSPPNKDFFTIKQELLRARSLYVDPDFPPNNRSLTFSGRVPTDLVRVEWKRPRDLRLKPKFIVDGTRRHDLDQGKLGDCWFVAGVATLITRNRKLFQRVVPENQDFDYDYAGIFRFNFWWYGNWREVVVDDYLPTDGRDLIYCRNREQPDEFWAALLEKAYAKLHGNYEALEGGKLNDTLVDMTGGITETLDLRNRDKLPNDLYRLLSSSIAMNSMLGASIFRPANATSRETVLGNGLVMGHAYSITDLKEVSVGQYIYRLLRMRNPWGRVEWTGRWSDGSKEMQMLQENLRTAMEFKKRDDGEFWMSFEDFVNCFDELQICHLQPDSMTGEVAIDTRKEQWNVFVYHDAWIRGVTAGGCGNEPYRNMLWKNPQFQLTVGADHVDSVLTRNSGLCTVIVSLMEKERDNRSNISIGFKVFQLSNPDKSPLNEEKLSYNIGGKMLNSGVYEYTREVTRRFELSPGHYVIIPTTFKPGEEAEFLLRIFTEKHVESGLLEETTAAPPQIIIRQPMDTMADIFNKHAGGDGKMDAVELKSFLSDISLRELKTRLEFSLEACRSLLTMVDRSKLGFLDEDAARQLWRNVKVYRDVFRQTDLDNSGSVDTLELNTMFNKIGFPVSRIVMTSIVRRYGGRENRINLEDFIIVISKLVLMYNVYVEHQRQKGSQNGLAYFTKDQFLEYTMYC